jgi:DNA-binding CsgD family transcriptional regulator
VVIGPTRRRRADIGEIARRLLVDAYAPPSVLIKPGYETLFYFGAIDRFLVLTDPEFGRNLIAMARDGLRAGLKLAVDRATERAQTVTLSRAELGVPPGAGLGAVTIRPVEIGGDLLLLVSFIAETPLLDRGAESATPAELSIARSSAPNHHVRAGLQRLSRVLADIDGQFDDHLTLDLLRVMTDTIDRLGARLGQLDAVDASAGVGDGRVGEAALSLPAVGRLTNLTERQQQILALIIAGQSNKAIAAQLNIAQRTVESHRALIMKRMGAASLADLVRLALAQA